MKRFISHSLVLFVAFLCVCGCISIDRESYEVMSELTISVSVSNTPGLPVAPQTKIDINAEDYILPVHDGEKIQTLRIVIVRPDGTIEHNRYMDFQGAVKHAYMEVNDVMFKVLGPERKKVYLFVNENSVKASPAGEGVIKTVAYDFDDLKVGDEFPTEEISSLQISLKDSYDTLPCESSPVTSALPMSECHFVDMPATDYDVDLYVTRAAVKFTYIFDNQTSKAYSLSQLTVSKGSSIEYYLPRITYTGNPFGSDFSVSDYVVPNTGDNNNYYVFNRFIAGAPSITLEASSVKTLDSFYFLEGKYDDPNGVTDENGKKLNYSMSATLNGIKYESYFPDVPWLPRNTHVVAVITIKEHKVTWAVDVYPYGEYWLSPGFGI